MGLDESIADVELDARGLNCPMPLLKLKQQLNKMVPGAIVLVQATDSGSWRDFDAFVRQAGHTMMESSEMDGVYRYIIKKKTNP